MGQRARLKSVKRRVKAAWLAASEKAKARVADEMEHGPLTQDEILNLLTEWPASDMHGYHPRFGALHASCAECCALRPA